jgi:hypothetical protein
MAELQELVVVLLGIGIDTEKSALLSLLVLLLFVSFSQHAVEHLVLFIIQNSCHVLGLAKHLDRHVCMVGMSCWLTWSVEREAYVTRTEISTGELIRVCVCVSVMLVPDRGAICTTDSETQSLGGGSRRSKRERCWLIGYN